MAAVTLCELALAGYLKLLLIILLIDYDCICRKKNKSLRFKTK